MTSKTIIAFMILSLAAVKAAAGTDDFGFLRSIGSKKHLSAAEDARKTSLINNANFLRSLKPVLNRTPATPAQAAEQNSAIDLLREAVRSGDSDTAIEVLRSVVMDEREDPELQASTARSPASEERSNDLVPSPARDRIWINLIQSQDAAMKVPSGKDIFRLKSIGDSPF